jgi:hypothetical protein
MTHPYAGDWFNWLAKCWVRVSCTLSGCRACKRDTKQCYTLKPMDLRHMVESGLMTRSSDS